MRTPGGPSELSVKMTGVGQGQDGPRNLLSCQSDPWETLVEKAVTGISEVAPEVVLWFLNETIHTVNTHTLVIVQTHKSKADKSILYFGILIMFLNDCMFILI